MSDLKGHFYLWDICGRGDHTEKRVNTPYYDL